MSNKKKSPFQQKIAAINRAQNPTVTPQNTKPTKPMSASMLDIMKDGREYESLVEYQYVNFNLINEFRRSIAEISSIRKTEVICYVANVVTARRGVVSIDNSDDLPFNEMISAVPKDCKEIDIVLVTPGGVAQQIALFVSALRPRFGKVNFLILDKAMSAGTIFALSGDEIVMRQQSHIGPIDPQVRTRNGEFLPAQALLTLIEDIKVRGEALLKEGKKPSWVDLQILNSIDPKEIGNAISASSYSINLVKEYLSKYKFKTWAAHSNGSPVTQLEKEKRADEIATLLCSHKEWKIHGHAITRQAAWDVCKLKVTRSEDTPGLDRAMRRFWALFYWAFESTQIRKTFISKDYCLVRSDKQLSSPMEQKA